MPAIVGRIMLLAGIAAPLAVGAHIHPEFRFRYHLLTVILKFTILILLTSLFGAMNEVYSRYPFHLPTSLRDYRPLQPSIVYTSTCIVLLISQL
ncbi:MAG: hypothetical protein IPN89_10840 [Saprospiraceae bacterium]|nr:hypothetical protein [Saprospiraceae bacterium]